MRQINRFLLAIVILIAIGIRVWGINYDLPYIYHPDEPLYVNISQQIFKTGDLNPHFFNYPSLFFYINSVAYIPYYLIGKFAGIFSSRADVLSPVSLIMGVTKAQLPSAILLGRLITTIFGIGTVIITYLVGKRIANKEYVGILAALLVAVEPTVVSLSRFITPDIFVTFFAMAAFLAILLVYKSGNTQSYIMAGILIGLTASCKYNGVLIILPLFVAHFLRQGKLVLKGWGIYLALIACCLAFIVTTPYALLDFSKFISDLRYEGLHYLSGHAGMEGNTFLWYVNLLWQDGGIVYILAILGIIYGFFTKRKEIILLSTFPIAYFIFISRFIVRNDRTILPLIPFLLLLAALFVGILWEKAIQQKDGPIKLFFLTSLLCVSVVAISFPSNIAVKHTMQLTAVDNREISRLWIASHLPKGSKIAIEAYSPWVDPMQYIVEASVRIIDHPPEWYIENNIKYLVFSQIMYFRYFQDPLRYSTEVALYNEFFSRFQIVKMFGVSNGEIRIYAVR